MIQALGWVLREIQTSLQFSHHEEQKDKKILKYLPFEAAKAKCQLSGLQVLFFIWGAPLSLTITYSWGTS